MLVNVNNNEPPKYYFYNFCQYFFYLVRFSAYNCLLYKIIRKILNQNLNPLKNFIQMVFIMMKCLSALIFSTIW